MGVIYCFTNKINGKKYIGQTINPKQRYSQHISDVNNKNSKDYDTILARAMRKYGIENFSYEELAKDVQDIEELNRLEEMYIKQYHSLVTENGYNIQIGGKNAPRPMKESSKRKLSLSMGSLSEQEVIELRKAYKNHESPSKIYREKYQDKMHYNAFLNIWSGRKYKQILPEYIQNGRRTKISMQQAQEIRKKYSTTKCTYKSLAQEYNVDPSTIGNIIKNKTHKIEIEIDQEPVTTISESGE